MSIAEKFNKKTIILLAAFVVIGGVAAAYLLFFKNAGIVQSPEPEKVAKRMKIEVPSPPEAKKETTIPAGTQTQAQPPVQQTALKPAEAKPEVKKKDEIKPAIKEVMPEKKAEAKKATKEIKETQKAATGKKTAYKPWAVHIASYTSKEEALAMVKRLQQDNYNAYMTEFDLKGKHWYRVRIGFYASNQEAKTAGKKISGSYSMNGIWTVKPMKKEIMSHLN